MSSLKSGIDWEKEHIEETYKDGWNAGDFGSDCGADSSSQADWRSGSAGTCV